MVLPRDQVVSGIGDELTRFEELVRSFDEREWSAPTRCAGWTVADVAAHVVGTMADVMAGRLEGLGTPEVTEREVAERRGRSPGELADELAATAKVARDLLAGFDDEAWRAPSPGGFDFTLGQGIEALWYDAVVHADDMRVAAGRPSDPGPGGVLVSVSHVADMLTQRGWGPATLALDGTPEVAVGNGSGRRVTGDPWQFVLVATGRADPAAFGLDESVDIYR